MSDDEILDTVRLTLSGVHMDRPVEMIKQRAGSRSRTRIASGVAGGALAVVAGAALAVPMFAGSTNATAPVAGGSTNVTGPIAGGPANVTAVHPELAAWSVNLSSGNTVVLTVRRPDFTDVGLLEKKLAELKVPAYVVTDQCHMPPSVHGPITTAKGVTVKTGYQGRWPAVYTIKPSAIPPGAHLIFTIYPQLKSNPKAPIPNNVELAPAGTTVAC